MKITIHSDPPELFIEPESTEEQGIAKELIKAGHCSGSGSDTQGWIFHISLPLIDADSWRKQLRRESE